MNIILTHFLVDNLLIFKHRTFPIKKLYRFRFHEIAIFTRVANILSLLFIVYSTDPLGKYSASFCLRLERYCLRLERFCFSGYPHN